MNSAHSYAATIDHLTHIAVALMIMQRRHRAVDRNLVKVRAAQADQLCIRIRKEATLEEGVAGEINPWHDVARMKGYLLGLREKVIGVAIECQFANALDRDQFFGNDLGGIQQIEIERLLIFFLNDLYPELPFRVITVFNSFPQIASMKVWILTGNFLGFIPEDRMNTKDRFPVKLDKMRLPLCIDESERVHTESFHHAIATRNRPI